MKTWQRVRVLWMGRAIACGILCVAPLLSGCATALRARPAGMFYPKEISGAPSEAPPAPAPAGGTSLARGAETRRAGIDAAGLPAATPGGGQKETLPAPPAPPASAAAEKRLVVYTAQFSILVGNVEDSMKELLKKIEQWQGYVQTADLKRVTFRLPATRFDRAVEEISQLGIVTNKQVQAQDVTRQYLDLQLRIEVAETSRKRLLELLEKANKTEELLKIETEVRRLTEEIERMKGELRLLADQIAYSTLTVELTARAAEVRRPRPRTGVSYFAWINQIGAEHVARNF